jgi:hypothetical protein
LLAIPSSLSRSYSTFPLCSWTTLIEIAVYLTLNLSYTRTLCLPHDHSIFQRIPFQSELVPRVFSSGYGIRCRVPRFGGTRHATVLVSSSSAANVAEETKTKWRWTIKFGDYCTSQQGHGEHQNIHVTKFAHKVLCTVSDVAKFERITFKHRQII